MSSGPDVDALLRYVGIDAFPYRNFHLTDDDANTSSNLKEERWRASLEILHREWLDAARQQMDALSEDAEEFASEPVADPEASDEGNTPQSAHTNRPAQIYDNVLADPVHPGLRRLFKRSAKDTPNDDTPLSDLFGRIS